MVSNMTSRNLSLVLQDDQAAEALLHLSLDFFLNQEVSSWLDLEIFFESLQSAYRPQVLQRLLSDWLPRALSRSRKLESLTQHHFATWLTPELDAEIRSMLATTQFLSPQRIHEFIQHPLVKHITQAFVEETLQRFVQKVKVGSEGGGLLGLAGRSAFGWASKASKGVFNGLGDQLQQHLANITHEFVSASMDVLLEQLGKIIATEEVANLLAQAQVDYYDQFKTKSMSQYLRLVFDLSNDEKAIQERQSQIDEWAELLSEWMTHLLEHPHLAEVVGQIHQDLIEEIGAQSPRMLIDDEDTINAIKESCITSLKPMLQLLTQQDSFTQWSQTYLGE